MLEKKRMTYSDLVSMKIDDRKILARKLLAEKTPDDRPRHLAREWGRFEDLPSGDGPDTDGEIAKLLSVMSLRQKVGQMTPDATIEEYVPACLKYNDEPYFAGENLDLEIPGIKFTDGPSGVVMGNSSTCFPVSIARGASWDPELEREIGEAIGKEAKSLGANLFAGVCINLLRHPAWGRSQETYGEDPHLLGIMGSALVRGAQEHVMACVKHFALNSMENARYKVDVEVDERSLREVYLPHFKACVDSGAASVMTAYNKVRGEYCGQNEYLIRKILKDEWGFEGFVISDFVFGIRDGKKAAFAGMDIEMPIPGHYGDNLVDLVERGEVPESIIDEAVARILRMKIRFAARSRENPGAGALPGCPEHAALARRAARESAVLLKNEGSLLPFDASAQKKIAVIGILAVTVNIGDMKGSSRVYPPYVITALDGLRDRVGAGVEVAWSDGEAGPGLDAALAGADAVIVVAGLTSEIEGEYIPHWNSGCGGDRTDLGLRAVDVSMIERISTRSDKVAVILQGGGAIMTSPWDSSVRAILMTWYPGMEGGAALANILYGDCNPSGKLPVTIPRDYGQLPSFDREADRASYGFFHGYFLADREAFPVSWPFGFGLSYTSYEYSDLSVSDHHPGKDDEILVSVQIRNAGSRYGEEIVQIYVGCERSAVLRHVKDLKAFGRIGLQPGQTVVFSRPLRIRDLAYYDESQSRWTVEKTGYRIYAGSSSRPQDLLSTTIAVR